MRAALLEAPNAPLELFGDLDALGARLQDFSIRLFGDPARQRLNEPTVPSISNRVGRVIGGHWDTRQTPTATHRRNLEIAETDFGAVDVGVPELHGRCLRQRRKRARSGRSPLDPRPPPPRLAAWGLAEGE